MSSRAAANMEQLQEDNERMLHVFRQVYGENISMQDLHDLAPPFVISIYLQFTKITLKASLDNMKMIGLNAPSAMKMYPEAYEKAILLPRVSRMLGWFFHTYFQDDSFSFTDLVDPRPNRTRHFFNHLVDFVVGYTTYKDAMESIRMKVADKRERRAALEAEKEAFLGRMKAVQKRRAESRITEEEERKQGLVLQTEVGAKQETVRELKMNMEVMRQGNAELRATLDAGRADSVQLQEDMARLCSAVVEQDELTALQQREQKVKQAQQETADKNMQVSEMEGILAATERMSNFFSNQIQPLVTDLENQMKEMSVTEDTQSIEVRQSKAMSKCEEQDHQLSVIKQKLALLQEKRTNFNINWTKKKEGIAAEVQANREMLEGLRRSDQDHLQAEKLLSEKLHQRERDLEAVAAELVTGETFFDKTYKDIIDGVEKHNQQNHAGMQLMLENVRDCNTKIEIAAMTYSGN